jgi:hypothetical protein
MAPASVSSSNRACADPRGRRPGRDPARLARARPSPRWPVPPTVGGDHTWWPEVPLGNAAVGHRPVTWPFHAGSSAGRDRGVVAAPSPRRSRLPTTPCRFSAPSLADQGRCDAAVRSARLGRKLHKPTKA